MKKPEEIEVQIRNEIAAHPSYSNPHGLDFSRCLVSPRIVPVMKGLKMDTPGEMWLVLEEDPEKHEGYRILYDEAENAYGLAMMPIGEGTLLFLGFYGTFIDTVEGM